MSFVENNLTTQIKLQKIIKKVSPEDHEFHPNQKFHEITLESQE